MKKTFFLIIFLLCVTTFAQQNWTKSVTGAWILPTDNVAIYDTMAIKDTAGFYTCTKPLKTIFVEITSTTLDTGYVILRSSFGKRRGGTADSTFTTPTIYQPEVLDSPDTTGRFWFKINPHGKYYTAKFLIYEYVVYDDFAFVALDDKASRIWQIKLTIRSW